MLSRKYLEYTAMTKDGLTVFDVLSSINVVGRFSKESAGYREPVEITDNPCATCRFFLRQPNNDRGFCEIVKPGRTAIAIDGSCKFFISSLATLKDYYDGMGDYYPETLGQEYLFVIGAPGDDPAEEVEMVTREIRKSLLPNGDRFEVVYSVENSYKNKDGKSRGPTLNELNIEKSKRLRDLKLEHRDVVVAVGPIAKALLGDKADIAVTEKILTGDPFDVQQLRRYDNDTESFKALAINEPEYVMTGTAMRAEHVDAHRDVATEKTIMESMESWMLSGAGMKLQHMVPTESIRPVQVFQPNVDMIINKKVVQKGDWWVKLKFLDKNLWHEAKEKGLFNGLSPGLRHKRRRVA